MNGDLMDYCITEYRLTFDMTSLIDIIGTMRDLTASYSIAIFYQGRHINESSHKMLNWEEAEPCHRGDSSIFHCRDGTEVSKARLHIKEGRCFLTELKNVRKSFGKKKVPRSRSCTRTWVLPRPSL